MEYVSNKSLLMLILKKGKKNNEWNGGNVQSISYYFFQYRDSFINNRLWLDKKLSYAKKKKTKDLLHSTQDNSMLTISGYMEIC